MFRTTIARVLDDAQAENSAVCFVIYWIDPYFDPIILVVKLVAAKPGRDDYDRLWLLGFMVE